MVESFNLGQAVILLFVTCDCYVVVQFLCNASEFDPPMFHNLSFLKVKGPCMLHVLPHLLQLTPNLAVLVVEKVYKFK